jgi:hypothetical protein
MTARNAAAHQLVDWARSIGCEVTRTRSQHWRVRFEGRVVGFIASTPSCPRSLKNSRAQILKHIRALKAARATN